MRILNIAGAAINQTPIDWDNNLKNILDAIKQAQDQSVDILCLPELCITGYGCEDLFHSNWLPSTAIEKLMQLLPHSKDIVVAIGLPIQQENKLYNCAALVENRKILGITAKQFLADEGVHYEPRWFTPWNAGEITELNLGGHQVPFGDIVYEVKGIKIGFEICEDAWRKNRPACRLAERGVELILNPSASHFGFGKYKRREGLILEGSKRYNCYYVYANLLGNEAGRMIYDGEIVIAGHGHIIKFNEKLSFKKVNLTSATVDFDQTPSEDHPIPDENKNEIFVKAEALALFDYLRKSRSRGFVLSLSGGADSSTCALLVAEMVRSGMEELGVEEFLTRIDRAALITKVQALQSTVEKRRFMTRHLLTCAYQGTVNSSEETLKSARELARDIGATFHHWLIDDEVTSYTHKIENALKRDLDWEADDLTLQNIQSRARSPIIWMLANINNALLLVTSNRSEADVGYSTMDGDTSGSIAPIAAVDKYFILEWLKWAEKKLDYPAIKYITRLQPTAELRPPNRRQTDETDLMPYRVIVEIEKLAIKDKMSPIEVFEKLKEQNLVATDLLKSYIVKFFLLWCRNQWKRERTAPAFHLDDFNVDPRTWCRFPILSSGYEDELKKLKDIDP